MTQRVYFGQGEQALVTIPVRDGRPVRVSAATYGIVDARYGDESSNHVVVAAGEAADIDVVSTTLSAKAGRAAADRRALTVVSTVGFEVGHAYLLEAASGAAELVRIAAVASGTVLRTTSEIRGDFPAASTLRNVEVAAAFPADVADDEDSLDGIYVITWSVDGLPPMREAVRVERGEEHLVVGVDDLARLDPSIPRAGGDRVDLTGAIAQARRDLRTDLRLAGVDEANLLAGPIGADAILYRAAALCMHHSDNPAAVRKAESYQARYGELRAALTIGQRTKPDVVVLDKDTVAATEFNPAGLFRAYGE
jgi:hypothetical protein